MNRKCFALNDPFRRCCWRLVQRGRRPKGPCLRRRRVLDVTTALMGTRCKTLNGGLHLETAVGVVPQSGRPDSNRRRPAWQAASALMKSGGSSRFPSETGNKHGRCIRQSERETVSLRAQWAQDSRRDAGRAPVAANGMLWPPLVNRNAPCRRPLPASRCAPRLGARISAPVDRFVEAKVRIALETVETGSWTGVHRPSSCGRRR